jgi:hypothetical protein
VNGDATVGSGSVIRGFFNFSGPGCDSDEIWGGSWPATSSPARSCCSRPAWASTWASARWATGPTCIPRASSPPSHPAVWTEQVGPGGEFAQTELFQAKTDSDDLARTQVTNNPDNDSQPPLAFRPGGGGELVFVRDNGFGNEPTHSYLRLATASGLTGAWAGSQFAAIGINTGPSIDTTPGTTGHTYVAWLRNGQVFEADDRSGNFQHKAFVSNGLSTDIGVGGGRTRVVWSEEGDGTVLAERLGSGGWTKETVYPAASRMRPIVLGATVLMASATRIYARTEVLSPRGATADPGPLPCRPAAGTATTWRGGRPSPGRSRRPPASRRGTAAGAARRTPPPR